MHDAELFRLKHRQHPTSTLFPYTTLFRAHHREIAGERCRQERRLPGEIHPRKGTRNPEKLSADRWHFFHPRVWLGAPFKQNIYEIEKRRAMCAVFKRAGVNLRLSGFVSR